MTIIPVPITCPTCGHHEYAYTVAKYVTINQQRIPNLTDNSSTALSDVWCKACRQTVLSTSDLDNSVLDLMIDA